MSFLTFLYILYNIFFKKSKKIFYLKNFSSIRDKRKILKRKADHKDKTVVKNCFIIRLKIEMIKKQ